jgi:uncharacterized damage-inducible protein DinB
VIREIEPVWKQFQETYHVLRGALAQVPDERLAWRPGGKANSIAAIVQHIISANRRYVGVIEVSEGNPSVAAAQPVTRTGLLQFLDESERHVRQALERLTPERLNEPRADRWGDWDDGSQGNTLDVLWFAMQMVRHSAYHLGQINLYLLMLEKDEQAAGASGNA